MLCQCLYDADVVFSYGLHLYQHTVKPDITTSKWRRHDIIVSRARKVLTVLASKKQKNVESLL